MNYNLNFLNNIIIHTMYMILNLLKIFIILQNSV